MKEGYLIIDKPNGVTSHDVVARVRKKFNMKRVGHAGTLDPLATGVLIILLGRYTKLFDRFSSFDKGYRATLILGKKTDSADTQGKTLAERPYAQVTRLDVENVFKQFVGTQDQLPPMFSAVKVKGKKLYQLARKGIEVERTARKINIHCLRMDEFRPPEVEFYIDCSKGTYIRQLADDIGDVLGCGACISQIQRTKIGYFNIKDAVGIEELNESHIRHWEN